MPLNSTKNCYQECPFYYFFDKEKNINYCTLNNQCTEEFNKLILEKKECVKCCNEEDEYKYEFRKKCFKKCPNNTELSKEKEYYCEPICNAEKPFERIKTQECVSECSIDEMQSNLCITKFKSNETNSEVDISNKMLNNIENDITGDNFNTSNIESGENKVIQKEKLTVTITTTDNQKSNKDSNMTNVDLGPCEQLLREAYNLNDDDFIYMEMIEVLQEGMKTPKIEINVCAKLNESN